MTRYKQTIAALLLAASLSAIQAAEYTIQYKGITLGDIDNLSETIDRLYLKAEVTNIIAKLLLRKKYFVFYAADKPHVENAKYRKDKNSVLYALKEAIYNRPAHKVYPSSKGKKLVLECAGKECRYTFYRRDKIKGKGKIEFDRNNRFYELTEIKSGVVIRRK